MSYRWTRPVVAVAALLALAGCGGDRIDGAGPDPAPIPAPAPPTTPAEGASRPEPASSPPATGVLPGFSGGAAVFGKAAPPTSQRPVRPGRPEIDIDERSVTGQIVPGGRPNCRLLRASGREFLLIIEPGEGRLVPVGRRVTVTGWLQPDLPTTCVRGVPLVVSRIRPA